VVAEAAGARARHTQPGVDLPQQQRPAVAGEGAPGKIDHDFSSTKVLKLERALLTVCRRPGGGG
jgi:hypothetical protein